MALVRQVRSEREKGPVQGGGGRNVRRQVESEKSSRRDVLYYILFKEKEFKSTEGTPSGLLIAGRGLC